MTVKSESVTTSPKRTFATKVLLLPLAAYLAPDKNDMNDYVHNI